MSAMHLLLEAGALLRRSAKASSDSISALVVAAIGTASSLLIAGFVIWLLFSRVRVGGVWHFEQAALVLSIYLIADGLVSTFLTPALSNLSTQIRSGDFDALLLLPGSLQIRLTIGQADLWRLMDCAFGVGMLVISLPSMGLVNGCEFAILSAMAVGIVYAIWLMIFSLNLWVLRLENVAQLFSVFLSVCRYPISTYPKWFGMVLSFSTPLAFVSTVPALVAFGHVGLLLVLKGTAIAVCATAISQWCLRKSVHAFVGI
ncbi:UNVERIFIED_ORG: ABC-type uncharacterized transport system permease subunit [Burkholderia contaminans]|nr:ABC-type uncharacterized transport system permease subunit [Burkholderia contaminans]